MNFYKELQKVCHDFSETLKKTDRKTDELIKSIQKIKYITFRAESYLSIEELILIMDLEIQAMNSRGNYITYIEEKMLGILNNELVDYGIHKTEIPKDIYDLCVSFLHYVYDFKREKDSFGGKRKKLILEINELLIWRTKNPELLLLLDKAFKYRNGKLILEILSCLDAMYDEEKSKIPEEYIIKIRQQLKKYDEYSSEYKLIQAFLREYDFLDYEL